MARRADTFSVTLPWAHAPARSPVRAAAPDPGPVAVLRFALPRPVTATVGVFDAAGHLLHTLLDGALPAGEHACRWDGRNAGGTRVAAGDYQMRLTIGDRVVTSRRVTIG